MTPRLLVCVLCMAFPAMGQTATALKDVKTVFVGSLGDKPDAAALRDELTSQLAKSSRFRIAASAAEADAVLGGTGEVWVKERYSLNPRERFVNSDTRAIYAGYLSVELHGKGDETLWSYLATPHSATSGDVNRDLARLVTRKLVDAVDGGTGTKH